MVVTIAQLVVGVMTESLGMHLLVSESVYFLGAYADCLHRMEHILSFIIVCIGRVLDKRGKDQAYSYGYGRHEYLLVFTLHLSIIIVYLHDLISFTYRFRVSSCSKWYMDCQMDITSTQTSLLPLSVCRIIFPSFPSSFPSFAYSDLRIISSNIVVVIPVIFSRPVGSTNKHTTQCIVLVYS